MKLRTRLTIQNTTVVAAVFLFCLILIYLISERTRRQVFYHDLKREAVTKAHLFLNNRVDPSIMQSIYVNNQKFINEVEVAVYSPDFQMLYHDAWQHDIVKETRPMIRQILRDKELEFRVGDYQAIGIVYSWRGRDYVVTAAAYDGYGFANLTALRHTLVLLFILGLSLLFAACYVLSYLSLRPIRQIVQETEKITARQIDRRLPVSHEKDELGELTQTLNALLERLETSFNAQRMFVSNVSHELRTPLASLRAELDLTLQKNRSAEEYKISMTHALHDAQRMTRLIDGLLNLAKADYQKDQIKMEEIRLDELLLDTRDMILRAHPDYHIELLFEQETADDDRLITVRGNLYLLNIAFANLIENNCKYAVDKSSFVQISYWKQWALVRFSDDGIGLSDTDKEHLFTLFYRGRQDSVVEGHGIGMALAQKIIHLHQGDIQVHSELGQGTTFIVELPHL